MCSDGSSGLRSGRKSRLSTSTRRWARRQSALVRELAGSLSCRVGGGVRTLGARGHPGAGARQVIAGSALFKDGRPDVEFAKALADAMGADRSHRRS